METGQWLGQVLNGWLNYYAVPTSFPLLRRFRHVLKQRWMRALRGRSQKDRFEWEKLDRMCDLLWPELRVRHPWPDRRFAVKYLR